jgi:hypothetical protein
VGYSCLELCGILLYLGLFWDYILGLGLHAVAFWGSGKEQVLELKSGIAGKFSEEELGQRISICV